VEEVAEVLMYRVVVQLVLEVQEVAEMEVYLVLELLEQLTLAVAEVAESLMDQLAVAEMVVQVLLFFDYQLLITQAQQLEVQP
jgi:hypothetical protein